MPRDFAFVVRLAADALEVLPGGHPGFGKDYGMSNSQVATRQASTAVRYDEMCQAITAMYRVNEPELRISSDLLASEGDGWLAGPEGIGDEAG